MKISLPLLAVMVVIGIAMIVCFVHKTGGSRVARLENPEAARLRFAEDFPDAQIADIVLTKDGCTAFLDLGGEKTGIVSSVGGRFLTRILSAADIAAMERTGEESIKLRFRDFTWKGGEFIFDSGVAADRLMRTFEQHEGVESADARL